MSDRNMPPWKHYQQEVAEFFNSIEIPAETDVTLRGSRGTHAVDVVARPVIAGQQLLWIVECKLWKRRVPKEKVLALQAIAQDVGADRAYLMTETGYQSGALQCARSTNLTLGSLGDLRETAAVDLAIQDIRAMLSEAEQLEKRYWKLPKSVRILSGLRGLVGVAGPPSMRRRIASIRGTCMTLLTVGMVPVGDPTAPRTLIEWDGELRRQLDECVRRIEDVEQRWQAQDPDLLGPAPVDPEQAIWTERIEAMLNQYLPTRPSDSTT